MELKLLTLLYLVLQLARFSSASPSSESQETAELNEGHDTYGTGMNDCLDEHAQSYGGPYGWISVNPSLLVSLAVYYNKTKLCRVDGPLDGVSGDSRSSILVQQDELHVRGTKTSKRNDDNDSSLDVRPTPAPTGDSQPGTTVHIASEHDFALLLPRRQRELISDAEADGVAFCTPGSGDSACTGSRMQDGFIAAAAVKHADDGSWIQVTGCLDASKSQLDPSDEGGQFDVRFPNGAQCTFGGYAASFIEQVEPAAKRFCLRCCASENDQVNCNSHRDRAGCAVAIPGTYDFPDIGVSCS